MIRRPPGSTRTDTLFPYTTLFRSLLELPGFRIGRNGVERAFDLPLRGHAGASQLEVNAVGRVIRELDRQEGDPGRDVVLTIDMVLQQLAMRRLGDESGAVVVLDVKTGGVIVQASTPSFDQIGRAHV